MQQVGRDIFLANASPVDPRLLPVNLRHPGRRALAGVSHAWVLHRTVFVRAASAFVVAALLVLLLALHQPILAGLNGLGSLVEDKFASFGFSVGEIEITGQTLSNEAAILAALGVEPRTSTLGFDVAAARDRVAELPAIESVTIRKRYPSDLIITVTEREPVARWRIDGVTFLVDAAGQQIGQDEGAYSELPLVIGDGAADDALVMIQALTRYPELSNGLIALSRIADRRWDMIFDTGLRVQLPEVGVAQALRRLSNYQRDYQLLDRDVSTIDLRLAQVVAVRPVERDEDQDDR